MVATANMFLIHKKYVFVYRYGGSRKYAFNPSKIRFYLISEKNTNNATV
jgi:hypothetical protein